jgi:hypothetical protein
MLFQNFIHIEHSDWNRSPLLYKWDVPESSWARHPLNRHTVRSLHWCSFLVGPNVLWRACVLVTATNSNAPARWKDLTYFRHHVKILVVQFILPILNYCSLDHQEHYRNCCHPVTHPLIHHLTVIHTRSLTHSPCHSLAHLSVYLLVLTRSLPRDSYETYHRASLSKLSISVMN